MGTGHWDGTLEMKRTVTDDVKGGPWQKPHRGVRVSIIKYIKLGLRNHSISL